MSTRDLARFALLYLHDGSWNGRQIVPSAWVRESTLSYSRTLPEFGPRLGTGYGYLWWIGFPNDVTLGVPMVNVPVRSFAAVGAQGQFALVMPAHDLVIVQRINTDVPIGSPPGQRKPAPSTRQMARLIWLLLSAAGVDDVGPDASLAHATGKHLEGEVLKTALAGTTLVIGGTLAGGARVWQLSADGHLSILIGAERREFRKGTWRVDGDHFCRTLIGTSVQDSCLSVVVKDYGFQFFDANGLMEFDARTE